MLDMFTQNAILITLIIVIGALLMVAMLKDRTFESLYDFIGNIINSILGKNNNNGE